MILPRVLKGSVREKPKPLWLEHLGLHDFRNYEHCSIEMSAGVNLILGKNAQGKTSLIEAVSLLSTGRLLRASKDALAIRHECESAVVEGKLGDSGTSIGIALRKGIKKRVELNGMSLPRASDLIGRLPTVSFSAADLCIANGEPSDRRQFLDWELAQLYPSYLKNLTVYKRAVEQRNALLRLAQSEFVASEVFESWEERIATSGAALRQTRRTWIELLDRDAREAHGKLGGGEELRLVYEERDEGSSQEALARLLVTGRGIDIARGTTGTGPHRDELLVRVNDQEARHFGSQGQQRTAVIAIKLATLDSAEQVLDGPPVLLLDDVFSDLDQNRRNRLMELTLDRGGQVFLTSTDVDQVGAELAGRSKVFRVDSGQVQSS